MLFVTPVIILLLVQMIINAGVYEMQTEYFSKNIILYYILYIIFLMIFRKVSVSASLYTIFLTVLALVDYFVTVFRGNALYSQFTGKYEKRIFVCSGIRRRDVRYGI